MGKSVDLFATGNYANGVLHFAALLQVEGENKTLRMQIEKPEREAQISAMGALLKYIEKNNFDATIRTDFKEAVEYADNVGIIVGEQANKYKELVSALREKQDIKFIPTGRKDMPKSIEQLMPAPKAETPAPKEAKSAWGKKKASDNYRVIVRKPDNTVICDYNQDDFGDKGSALYFASWYVKESKNPDSMYYGCKVQHYGLVDKQKKSFER